MQFYLYDFMQIIKPAIFKREVLKTSFFDLMTNP